MKKPSTRARLAALIQSEIDAGNKVRFLDVTAEDQASLIEEIRNEKGPLAKQMKADGIDVALPSISGVPIRWRAAETKACPKNAVA